MKILNSRKKVIAALYLSAIALTGCNKINTVEHNGRLYNIEDNSLLKDNGEELSFKEFLTYNSTGLSISIMPSQYYNQLDIRYDTDTQASDDIYEYVNNAINEMTGSDTLSIHLSKANLDFSRVDVSKFKAIMFDVANVDFDYTPFYNNTYTFLSININKTNIASVIEFFNSIKTDNARIFIDFDDDMNVEDTQRVIDTLAKINSVDSIDLSSRSINEINVVDLACHTLTLHNSTTNENINYDLRINDAVENLYVESSFAEEYENGSYLETFKVNSNNEKLSTHYLIFSNKFNISADDYSVIDVPENTELIITGLDISKVSNEWLKKFSNLYSVSITSNLANGIPFSYDRELSTIDDAIADKRLKEIGITYKDANNYISIGADATSGVVKEELYTILKEDFTNENNDYLVIKNLNNQFDFSKVDLTNISMVTFVTTGPDFDFTPFYNQKFTYLELLIGEDTNHERVLEFLKNIPDRRMTIDISFLDVEECQKPELQQRYVDALCSKENLEEVTMDTNIADCLNYENLITENLVLFIKSEADIINYDVSINDQVQECTILTSYDEEYNEEVYIGDIKVNSNNNALTTNLFFSNNSLNNCFNVNLDSDLAKIIVPNASRLELSGVNFDSIDYEAVQALNYLRLLFIHEDGNEDYVFCYHYEDSTFEEALNNFKDQNKNRKGKSLTNK